MIDPKGILKENEIGLWIGCSRTNRQQSFRQMEAIRICHCPTLKNHLKLSVCIYDRANTVLE